MMTEFIKDQVHQAGGLKVIEDTLDFAYKFSIDNRLTDSLNASCIMDLKHYLISVCLNNQFDCEDDSIMSFKKSNDCYEFLDELSNKLIIINNPYAKVFIEIIELNRAIMNLHINKSNIMRIA